LKSDNGGEYTCGHFIKFCEDHGISRQYIVPYTPEQNGVLEQKNRTSFETAQSMLTTSKLPHKFWAKAMLQLVAFKTIATHPYFLTKHHLNYG